MTKFTNLSPDFLLKLNKLQKLQRKFPDIAGIEAVKFSKERFVNKNWIDKTAEPWPPRKSKAPGSLMVGKGSGRLKRSIRKLKVTSNSVTIGTDVPYAQIHNEGGTIKKTVTVKSHSRKRKGRNVKVKSHSRKMNLTMPKRQFIGESSKLMNRIEELLETEINNILK
ncbi:MAG TPA: phage virion morphogenesis protein [Flavobacterium sp.]|jgi:phage gpG-like protein